MPTKTEVARHLNVDGAQVRRWVARGMPLESLAEAEAWHRTYIRTRRSRKTAVEVIPDAGDDPPTRSWRDRLDAANARVRELELERKQGGLVPLSQLTLILASAARQIVGVLDGLPVALRRRAPGISPAVLKTVDVEITKAREMAAAIVPEVQQ